MTTIWTGVLEKMRVEATDPVSYWLSDGAVAPRERAADLPLNPLLGQPVELRWTQEIACIACGRSIKKTFGQGYCYPCFTTRPEADTCLFKPELCHFHDADDPCRDPEWGLRHCFQPHVLYASLTSGVKVGITRQPNVPARWIDQGATRAVPLAVLPSRLEVGKVEHRLAAEGVNDKTAWQRMLKGDAPPAALDARVEALVATLESWGVEGVLSEADRVVQELRYPVLEHPKKVKSLDLAKLGAVSGELRGIKAQYLILDTGVINLRKFTGFEVALVV